MALSVITSAFGSGELLHVNARPGHSGDAIAMFVGFMPTARPSAMPPGIVMKRNQRPQENAG
jgi:hypothetical protein